jgi:hypothetical protein
MVNLHCGNFELRMSLEGYSRRIDTPYELVACPLYLHSLLHMCIAANELSVQLPTRAQQTMCRGLH